MELKDILKLMEQNRIKKGAWEPFELRGYTLALFPNAVQPFGGNIGEGLGKALDNEGHSIYSTWVNMFGKIGDIDYICLN